MKKIVTGLLVWLLLITSFQTFATIRSISSNSLEVSSSPSTTVWLSVNRLKPAQTKINPVSIEQFNELKAEVNDLKKEIATLKSKTTTSANDTYLTKKEFEQYKKGIDLAFKLFDKALGDIKKDFKSHYHVVKGMVWNGFQYIKDYNQTFVTVTPSMKEGNKKTGTPQND
jgi:soluble cytochrome b562